MPSIELRKHAAVDGSQAFLPELCLQSVIVSESVIQFLLPEKYPSKSEYLVRYMDGDDGLSLMSYSQGIPFIP